MAKPPKFELDIQVLKDEHKNGFVSICWYCLNRHQCPLHWECETLENLDHDDSGNGDE